MKQISLGLALSSIAPICLAAVCASTQYVDSEFAGIQSQINAINSNPAVAHPVGSCYGDGIVFYTNTTSSAAIGQHGLIVKLVDSTTDCTGVQGSCVWANPAPGAVTTSPGYFTGQTNTNTITATYLQTEAANAAYDNTSADDCPTCTNWYLPSQYELYSVYAQARLNGAAFWTDCGGTAPLTDIPYWSSSQVPGLPAFAWLVDFDNGLAGGVNSASARRVRAVRAF